MAVIDLSMGVVTVETMRHRAGSVPAAEPDDLAREEPLEIRVGGRSIAVTMRTPGEDIELAAGFLVSEGIIQKSADVASIAHCDGASNIVNVFLSEHVCFDTERLTRHVFASSSCGLCGKATIDSVRQQFAPISSIITVPAAILSQLPLRMRAAQPGFAQTGGLHAAALFSSAGDLLMVREDVGRHNAVDKVLGHGILRNQLPFDRHILLVSGRASFEIMQKALAGGVPMVCAVSAPSSLAVEFARESGQTLVGFVRDSRLNVYAGEVS